MDAAVALLRELAPLAREYGWPAVWAVVLLPCVLRIGNALVELIAEIRRCLPRALRNQKLVRQAVVAIAETLKPPPPEATASRRPTPPPPPPARTLLSELLQT